MKIIVSLNNNFNGCLGYFWKFLSYFGGVGGQEIREFEKMSRKTEQDGEINDQFMVLCEK